MAQVWPEGETAMLICHYDDYGQSLCLFSLFLGQQEEVYEWFLSTRRIEEFLSFFFLSYEEG